MEDNSTTLQKNIILPLRNQFLPDCQEANLSYQF